MEGSIEVQQAAYSPRSLYSIDLLISYLCGLGFFSVLQVASDSLSPLKNRALNRYVYLMLCVEKFLFVVLHKLLFTEEL